MNPGFPDDPMLTRLRALPRVIQDQESIARIRARSRAALARPHQQSNTDRRLWGRIVDGAFAVVSVVYLSGALAQALRLFSAFR